MITVLKLGLRAALMGESSVLTTRATSLRVWLYLLVLVVAVPIAGFSAYALLDLEQEQQRLMRDDLRHRTRDAASLVDLKIRKQLSVLRTLTDGPEFSTNDLQAAYDQAKEVTQHEPAIRSITLIDRNDRMLFLTALPYGSPTIPVSQLASVHRVFETGLPVVSGAFFAATPAAPTVVAVSAPVFQGGRVTHVIRAIVSVEVFEKLLNELNLGPGRVAGITDTAGNIVTRTAAAAHFIGKPASPKFLAAVRRGEQGTFESTTVDGITGTAAIAPIFDGQWHLGIGVSDTVFLAPLKAKMLRLALWGILCLVVGLLLARLLADHLMAQTRRLLRDIQVPTSPLQASTVTEFRQLLKEFHPHRSADADRPS